MLFGKEKRWRSEAHRRNVASLSCVACGFSGYTQAAHRNEGKGMGIKSCDSQMMALCVDCHRNIDQGGKVDKETRRAMEKAYVKATRQKLIDAGLWSFQAQQAYDKAHK